MAERKRATKATTPSTTKRAKPDKSEDIIKKVNALKATEFRDQYTKPLEFHYKPRQSDSPSEHANPLGQAFYLTLHSPRVLNPEEMAECYNLVETTSRDDYEASSWGWHPARKIREMNEEDMRYLVIRSCDVKDREIKGFLSFMFTYDSEPRVPVLYVYEIHLVEGLRKVGLGAHLMKLAESFAKRIGVEKVMLTCFLSNQKALDFYAKRGYMQDASSPEDRKTRNGVVKADYIIMSKKVSEIEQ
ncbi:hypothetical protein LTR17_004928 [Elasticomyces elasticus]|nr:hypothetical protein LTR17_004928 [Elasticomyces elasticus]